LDHHPALPRPTHVSVGRPLCVPKYLPRHASPLQVSA
jgi:hypothetical protein